MNDQSFISKYFWKNVEPMLSWFEVNKLLVETFDKKNTFIDSFLGKSI